MTSFKYVFVFIEKRAGLKSSYKSLDPFTGFLESKMLYTFQFYYLF